MFKGSEIIQKQNIRKKKGFTSYENNNEIKPNIIE